MTVVTREAEWDEVSVSRAMELDRYESGLCPCGCGQSLADATDSKRVFRIQPLICYARRALDRHEADEAAKAEAKKLPDGWANGTTYYIDKSFVPEPKGGVPA